MSEQLDLIEELISASLSLPGKHIEINGEPANENVCTMAAREIERLRSALANVAAAKSGGGTLQIAPTRTHYGAGAINYESDGVLLGGCGGGVVAANHCGVEGSDCVKKT